MKLVINTEYGGFDLSDQAIEAYEKRTGQTGICSWQIDRHDADLVAVVEQLGKAADGDNSKLSVETITEDRYFIREYDGAETLYTPSNLPWVIVNQINQ